MDGDFYSAMVEYKKERNQQGVMGTFDQSILMAIAHQLAVANKLKALKMLNDLEFSPSPDDAVWVKKIAKS